MKLRACAVLAVLATLVVLGIKYVERAQRDTHATGGTALADYRQAAGLVESGDLYAINYSYPPAFALAMRPIATPTMPVAATVWFALQVAVLAATIGAVWIVLRRTGVERPAWVLALSVAACGRFLLNNLTQGQVNTFVLLLVLAAVLALARGRELRAGGALAAAATIKFLPLVFLPGLATKRLPRATLAMGGTLVVLNALVPAAILGPTRTSDLSAQWWETTIAPYFRESASADPRNLALAAVIRDADVPDAGVKLVLAGVLLVTLLVVARTWRDRSLHRLFVDAALLLSSLLLVSPKTWKAHYVWLLPAFVVLTSEVVARWRSRAIRDVALRAGTIAVAWIGVVTSKGILGPRATEWIDAERWTAAMACGTWMLLVAYASRRVEVRAAGIEPMAAEPLHAHAEPGA